MHRNKKVYRADGCGHCDMYGAKVATKMSRGPDARRRLIIAECANHSNEFNGIQHSCIVMGDGKCRFFYSDSPVCGYFETSVLPLDPELEAVYRAEKARGQALTKTQQRLVAEEAAGKGLARVRCRQCGGVFPARSNRQKYCPECKAKVNREQVRARKKKQRQKGRVKWG